MLLIRTILLIGPVLSTSNVAGAASHSPRPGAKENIQ